MSDDKQQRKIDETLFWERENTITSRSVPAKPPVPAKYVCQNEVDRPPAESLSDDEHPDVPSPPPAPDVPGYISVAGSSHQLPVKGSAWAVRFKDEGEDKPIKKKIAHSGISYLEIAYAQGGTYAVRICIPEKLDQLDQPNIVIVTSITKVMKPIVFPVLSVMNVHLVSSSWEQYAQTVAKFYDAGSHEGTPIYIWD